MVKFWLAKAIVGTFYRQLFIMKEKLEQLFNIMLRQRCVTDPLINKNFDIPNEIIGNPFRFIKSNVNGVVLFEGTFAYLDMDIDDIIEADRIINKYIIKANGRIFRNAIDGSFLKIGLNGAPISLV